MERIRTRLQGRLFGIVILAMVGAGPAEKRAAPSTSWVAQDQRTLTHERGAYAVAFSPDSKRLLTAAADLTLRLWDVSSGRELKRFQGDKAWHLLWDIAWSPDGR